MCATQYALFKEKLRVASGGQQRASTCRSPGVWLPREPLTAAPGRILRVKTEHQQHRVDGAGPRAAADMEGNACSCRRRETISEGSKSSRVFPGAQPGGRGAGSSAGSSLTAWGRWRAPRPPAAAPRAAGGPTVSTFPGCY